VVGVCYGLRAANELTLLYKLPDADWDPCFEQRQEVIVYWWSKSHRGHLPEAAADALANGFLSQEEPVPVPHLPSRHVSARGYAKSSERELMLAAYKLFIVREHFKRGDAVRASAEDVDALRPAKLNELHGLRVLRLRDDHARLMRRVVRFRVASLPLLGPS
jgi:hypothetical protein